MGIRRRTLRGPLCAPRLAYERRGALRYWRMAATPVGDFRDDDGRLMGREGMRSMEVRAERFKGQPAMEPRMVGAKVKRCPKCAQLVGDAKCDAHRRKVKRRSYKISPKVREAVYDRDGNRCVKCGTTKKLTLDHIVPRSKGGSNKPDNLQTMCRPCNNAKGDFYVQSQVA